MWKPEQRLVADRSGLRYPEIERSVEMRRCPHGNVTCFTTVGNLVHERRDVSEHIDEVPDCRG